MNPHALFLLFLGCVCFIAAALLQSSVKPEPRRYHVCFQFQTPEGGYSTSSMPVQWPVPPNPATMIDQVTELIREKRNIPPERGLVVQSISLLNSD